jgi:RHS repeat-associated protein
LLGDHLGSSSVTTDANGAKTASALYKAFGETRYTLGNLGTDYKFTGQREEASLGIYFFNARWMDPSLGRFTSPDTIVPTGTQGTQAWDRYAFVNNNPVRYNDPTGHQIDQGDGGCTTETDCNPTSDVDILASVIATGNRAKERGGNVEGNADLIYYRQLAVEIAIKVYDIRLASPDVNFDAYSGSKDFLERPGINLGYQPNFDTSSGGILGTNIKLGEKAFSSAGWLGVTIGHENVHLQQTLDGTITGINPGYARNEVHAYNWELDHRVQFGLTDEEIFKLETLKQDYMTLWLNTAPIRTP